MLNFVNDPDAGVVAIVDQGMLRIVYSAQRSQLYGFSPGYRSFSTMFLAAKKGEVKFEQLQVCLYVYF
jgi:hypothetical protein